MRPSERCIPIPPHTWIDLPALLLLIAANSAPVLVTRWLGDRWNRPIDGGVRLGDGRPVFGPHKTWRGLVSGIAAASLLAVPVGVPVVVGTAFGALALAGDLLSSFLKRRLDLGSGRWAPLIDQLPEALVPLVILRGALGLGWVEVLATAGTFTALDLVSSRFSARIQRRTT